VVNPYIHSRIGFFGVAIFIEDFLLAGADLAKNYGVAKSKYPFLGYVLGQEPSLCSGGEKRASATLRDL
jgi:hypothetical protein